VTIFTAKLGGVESPPPPTQASEQEMRLRVVPGSFLGLFVKLNHLEPVSHFLFQPGMLFNDTCQWWGSKSMRLRPHEGIDLYLMEDVETGVKNVLPQMLIPTLETGHLVHFHRDFLGETLYIRHSNIREGSTVLHTIYGHTASFSGVRDSVPSMARGHLQPGTGYPCPTRVNKGQTVGMISSPPETSTVPAHLHISCAWIRESQQVDELNWKNMTGNINVNFIDPLPFLIQ
jgi:hypothetical protein